jgi:hypothetical protein
MLGSAPALDSLIRAGIVVGLAMLSEQPAPIRVKHVPKPSQLYIPTSAALPRTLWVILSAGC